MVMMHTPQKSRLNNDFKFMVMLREILCLNSLFNIIIICFGGHHKVGKSYNEASNVIESLPYFTMQKSWSLKKGEITPMMLHKLIPKYFTEPLTW